MPPAVRFKNILVAYNGFGRTEGLPVLALALAREHRARIHVVHVAPESPRRAWTLDHISAQELHGILLEERRGRLETIIAPAKKKRLDVRAKVLTGAPHVELIRESIAIKADLLMVTDEPPPRGRPGFGQLPRKLLRECPCPVLANRHPRRSRHARILAAVDVDTDEPEEARLNRRILETAAMIAKRARGRLIVFHAWFLWGEQLLRGRPRVPEKEIEEVQETIEQARSERLDALIARSRLDGVKPHVELVNGRAPDLLPSVAAERKIDLVVMGTVSRAGISGMLIGNTAEKVLNELECSVLALKPAGFVSPVSSRS